jgi:hypothetical protein
MKKSSFRTTIQTTTLILLVITAALALLYWQTHADWALTCAISFGTTLYHFAMRLAVGYCVTLFIKNFDPKSRWFRPRKWEAGLYRRLKVRSWKRHLPTFDPEKFSTEFYTLPQIVQNMCQAELVHVVIVVLSFVPLAFVPLFGVFGVFLATSLASGLLDCVFIIVQRYNRPRLVRIIEKGTHTHE